MVTVGPCAAGGSRYLSEMLADEVFGVEGGRVRDLLSNDWAKNIRAQLYRSID